MARNNHPLLYLLYISKISHAEQPDELSDGNTMIKPLLTFDDPRKL